MRYFWRRSAVFFKRLSEWRRGFFRRLKKILGRTHRPISMALTELHGLSGSNTVGGASSATGKVLTIRKRLDYSRNEEKQCSGERRKRIHGRKKHYLQSSTK